MSIFNAVQLLGGLALFLYGMSVMSDGLERISGGRMEEMLEKLTSNLPKAILLGMIVTATIQSSSATTVIAVGLVNAGILKLRQAIGIIMGANIGTTITAHILRLSDIDAGSSFALQIFKPANLAPLAALIGILLYYISKKNSRREIGLMLLGFCVLFTGMFQMEAAVSPLRDEPVFMDMFANFTNPIFGVLVGALVTAVIQSSAASIGILQALTVTGAITASNAFPIILGQNIGTCITPVLASIGASRNARRTALVHVSFNVIGTIVFLVGMYAIQYSVGFPFWDEPISKGGIANFHTVFNIVATLLFVPFTGQLERLANFLIKPNGNEVDLDAETALLDERFLGSPAFAISHAREAVVRMANLSLENYNRSAKLVLEFDAKQLEQAREVENVIDRLQSKVDIYLLKLGENVLTEAENTALSEVLQVVNEFERIGDHSDNMCDVAQSINQNGVKFSATAVEEYNTLVAAGREILEMAVRGYEERETSLAYNIEPLEEVINIMVESLKVHHNERLQSGLCSVNAAFAFVEILYNIERVADHCSNVGVHVISYSGLVSGMDRHEFLREMRNTRSPEYQEKFTAYDKKYFERISNE